MCVGSVRFETQGSVTRASLARPPTRNALTPEMLDGLKAALAAAIDAASKVLVIRGDDGYFCAGAALDRVLDSLDDPGAYVKRIASFCDALEAVSCATLAVVEGFALGSARSRYLF